MLLTSGLGRVACKAASYRSIAVYFMNRKMAMIGAFVLHSICNSYRGCRLICTGVCMDARDPWTCTALGLAHKA